MDSAHDSSKALQIHSAPDRFENIPDSDCSKAVELDNDGQDEASESESSQGPGEHKRYFENIAGGNVVVGNSFSGPANLYMNQDQSTTIHQYGLSLFNLLDECIVEGNGLRFSWRERTEVMRSPCQYKPKVKIKDATVRTELHDIVQQFQFVDAAFAEFYQAKVSYNQRVLEQLRAIHETFRHASPNDSWYSGSLGEFLERTTTEKSVSNGATQIKFSPGHYGEMALNHLQGGYEIPYWILLGDILIPYCNSGAVGKAIKSTVSRVIDSVRLQVSWKLKKLTMECAYTLPEGFENAIIGRLDVLNEIAEAISFDLGTESDFQAILSQIAHPRAPLLSEELTTEPDSAEDPACAGKEDLTDIEKVRASTLFILFFAIAIIPACIGFARYWNAGPDEEEAIGSSSDADFMWLIAGNLLALLGNVFAVLPLWRLTRGTTTHFLTQSLIWSSAVLGVASVASYCFVNKAWSSLLSFFSNFFAISAVYFSTQHVGTQGNGRKVKTD